MMKLEKSTLICAPFFGVFMAVMSVGIWQMIAAAQHPDGLAFPSTWADFRAGRMTGGLEKQLDQKLPIRSTLIAAANSTRYLLTGGAGDQVRVGKNDFLFLTDELKYEPDGEANLSARAQLLGAAARALKNQQVQLVVALVPDKARVYAQFLKNGHYPSYNESRYSSAIAALNQQEVVAVDLFEPLAQAAQHHDVYYLTDTHWNQTGARIAAERIARQVKALALELKATGFKTEPSGLESERAGDLIHLMGLDDMPNRLRPKPDRETPLTTSQAEADTAADLFGDATVAVTLTGTSYSMRGNFHGFLQQALMTKVLNTAKDGGGLLDATTAYLNNDAFKQTKPKLIVWEIPERFLYNKLDKEPTWLDSVGLLH
ncbi:MAG: cell division protein FtsQ [Comamonadaceae bacterium CG_4_10_14_0_8_um_filter_57_29]|nr:MAG: cell division protein FtsQ [Comamonadaceae bacterium CG_4_10_14_0_8_um_filter_57_29]